MGLGFQRRTAQRYSKLGKGRKKKQTWRRPTGRHNKMREKRKGYPKTVSIGYGKENKITPILVYNPKELESLKKGDFAIIGKVGEKMKLEIAKKAKELNVEIKNMNPKGYLKKEEKKQLLKKKKPEKKVESKKEEKKTEDKSKKEESKPKDKKPEVKEEGQ